MIDKVVDSRLKMARVARLATRDPEGRPHLVPVCFAYAERTFYTAVDRKPKRWPAGRLARVRNLRANSEVALLVDHYEEDWNRLWYILVRGRGDLLTAGPQQAKAVRRLKKKYPQYSSGRLLSEKALVIRIRPVEIISWSSGVD